jgi:tetratricopeptide (TPR) repeat protein
MNQSSRKRQITIPRNILCWIKAKTSKRNEDVQNAIEGIRHSVQSVYTFDDLNSCIDFLTDFDENETIYLMISEPIEGELLSLLDSFIQIKRIYLISDDAVKDHRESRRLRRINGPIGKINRDIHQDSNDLISFQTYKSTSNDLNSSFLYSQLIKEMLIDAEIEYDEDYINSFLEVCRYENQDNQSQLKNLDYFEKMYKNYSPVWWYTKESFLYSTVNRALRMQDKTILFLMGFFIRDLHYELIKLQQTNVENQSFHRVYRGQGMIESEFQRLQQNIGSLLSFNNFLSTSSDYDVSLMFARSARDNPEHLGILFRLNLDSPSPIESPFASLHGVSYYPDENEILFSMHTIFRIIDVREMETRLWLIELQLTNDKDEQLNELLQQLRSEINVPAVFNVDKVGQLCLKMGDYDGALEVYQTLLRLFPDNQVLLTYIHQHLGLVYQNKNDLDQAIIHYEKTIEIQRLLSPENVVDQYCIVTYANLSGLFVNKGDLIQAKKYCERALNLYLQVHQGEKYDPINHCHHLNNLAFIQRAEGDLQNALLNYQKVIDLRQKHLSPYHPDLVVSYSNLATVQEDMGNHIDSVRSYKHALDISIKSLPNNHEYLATLNCNMAMAYENSQQYDHALKHIQSAIETAQQLGSFDQEKLKLWNQLAKEFEQNCAMK